MWTGTVAPLETAGAESGIPPWEGGDTAPGRFTYHPGGAAQHHRESASGSMAVGAGTGLHPRNSRLPSEVVPWRSDGCKEIPYP